MGKSRMRQLSLALAGALVLAVCSPIIQSAVASTSVSYDFNSAGDLAAGFTDYIEAGSVATQSTTGGISNSGAIAAQQFANTQAVFASRASYSMGPVGSTYTFSSYMQSQGGNGYSGMGFTSLVPSSSTASGTPFRPADALGISVHGGGFVFHNGANDFHSLWDGTARDPAITSVTPSPDYNVIGNTSNSPDSWYKIVLVIVRDSTMTFDMQLQVWPSNSDGTLRTNAALAVFELNNQQNATLLAAPSINTYINFSGNRVYFFDNYEVSLAGGSSVIQAGSPVVLTSGAVDSSNIVTVSGDVTATGGAPVTERGFVYGTSSSPTVADSKIIVGSGTGSFSSATSTLPNGTYYFRAYATNSTGTSYGSEEVLVLTNGVASSVPAAQAVGANSELGNTGITSPVNSVLGALALMSFGLGLLLLRGRSRFPRIGNENRGVHAHTK